MTIDAPIAALLGALIGLTGGLILKALDLLADRDRWRRARRDEIFRDSRRVAGELAAKLAEFVHSTMWFSYKMDEGNRASWKTLQKQFDEETHSLIAALKGAEVRLAAMDPRLREVFRPLVNEAIRLSEDADDAAAKLIDDGDPAALTKLNRKSLEFIKELPQKVADQLGEGFV